MLYYCYYYYAKSYWKAANFPLISVTAFHLLTILQVSMPWLTAQKESCTVAEAGNYIMLHRKPVSSHAQVTERCKDHPWGGPRYQKMQLWKHMLISSTTADFAKFYRKCYWNIGMCSKTQKGTNSPQLAVIWHNIIFYCFGLGLSKRHKALYFWEFCFEIKQYIKKDWRMFNTFGRSWMQTALQWQSAWKFQANLTYTRYDIILLPLSQEIPDNIVLCWLTP